MFCYGGPRSNGAQLLCTKTSYTNDHEYDRESLQWRHNGRDGVSNHQTHLCLLNRLFMRRS